VLQSIVGAKRKNTALRHISGMVCGRDVVASVVAADAQLTKYSLIDLLRLFQRRVHLGLSS
jgi:hypothetical protein